MYSENWISDIEENIEYIDAKRKNSIEYYSCNYDTSLGIPVPENIKRDYLIDELYSFKNLAFGLFQIDLENYFEIKFHMLKQMQCQFSEVESLPYYELEMMIEKLKKWLEKEKEMRDKEDAEYKDKSSKNSYTKDADSMMKKYGMGNKGANSYTKASAPKIPKMPR